MIYCKMRTDLTGYQTAMNRHHEPDTMERFFRNST